MRCDHQRYLSMTHPPGSGCLQYVTPNNPTSSRVNSRGCTLPYSTPSRSRVERKQASFVHVPSGGMVVCVTGLAAGSCIQPCCGRPVPANGRGTGRQCFKNNALQRPPGYNAGLSALPAAPILGGALFYSGGVYANLRIRVRKLWSPVRGHPENERPRTQGLSCLRPCCAQEIDVGRRISAQGQRLVCH